MTRPSDHDVVVVGAGPAGLALAVLLRRAGVRCLVVEQHTERDRRTKAVTVHAPTLEFLYGLGLLDETVARGIEVERISFHVRDGGSFHGRMTGLDTFVDGYLNIPQPAYEELLERCARDHGVPIWYGVRYVSHHIEGGSGDILVRLAGGERARARCRYLVGCDGVGSAVRRGLGIEMPGRDLPSSYLLAEGRPLLPVDQRETALYVSDAGMVTLVPLPDGQVRVAGPAATNLMLAPSATVSAQLFTETVDSLGFGDRLRLREKSRITHYAVQERIAERFVDGPVALAGDAAHLNAPAGGQGLNLGIGDAVALAWRLVLALRRDAPTVLAGYDTERRAAAAEAIAASNVLPLVARMRRARTPDQERRVQHDLDGYPARWSQLYPPSGQPDKSGYRFGPGTRVPTVLRSAGGEIACRLLPVDLAADSTTLLVLKPGGDRRTPSEPADVARSMTPPLGQVHAAQVPESLVADRHLWPANTTALLVRPDRRVAAVLTKNMAQPTSAAAVP